MLVIVLVGLGIVIFRPSRIPDEAAYRANNLGVAQLEQFDYDSAAQSFRRALEIAPALTIARLNLAIALLHDGHLEAAETEARAVSLTLPDSPHAHYVLGLVLRSQNRADAAMAAFQRVAAIDPDDVGTSVNLGQIQQEERRFAEATTHFKRALENEPYSITAAYGLAMALARAESVDQSAEAMARFQELQKSGYGTTLSQAYLGQGKYAEAITSTGLEPELVDESIPRVAYTDATSITLGDAAHGPYESVTLTDLEGDGDLDLVGVSGDTVRALHNHHGRFSPGPDIRIAGTRPQVIAAGDFDNDARVDVFIAGDPVNRLLLQGADGSFGDLRDTGDLSLGGGAARAAAPLDFDHDGDLDVVVGGTPRLLRNNGNGTFRDATLQTELTASDPSVRAIVPTDYDNRRDIDIVIVWSGRAPALFRNLRDGRVRDVAAEVGFPPSDEYTAVTAGDLNKDGITDFFFGRASAVGVFAESDGVDRYRLTTAPDGTARASAAMLVDYDNDGLLDLLVLTVDGPKLLRHLGDRWTNVSSRALPNSLQVDGDSMAALVMGDLDADGDADAIIRSSSGRLRAWRNDGGSRNHWLGVRLAPRVSNRSAVGASVEVRAGSLRQKIETSASTPAVAPTDIVFGLGRRQAADAVRVLWPAGILQAETNPAGPITITELDRKPSSCPFLFAWNGSRFEFVTDFLGGGELGYWISPSTWNRPDADEYVRIHGDLLQPRNGRYEIVVTNELEEATFIDRLVLWSVDHASEVEIFPNEGLKATPTPLKLFASKSAKPPPRVVDDHGHDVRSRVVSIDGQYPDDFALGSIRGYAEPHTLTLDLGPGAGRVVLLLTGWTDYAFSSDNVAAHQAGIALSAPSLQVKEGGVWRTVVEDVGFPVGRPQTVVVDLDGKLDRSSQQVRLLTNMRIYWDQILVDRSRGRFATRLSRNGPIAADLRWRGFSTPSAGVGQLGYDYERVSTTSPWKAITGHYTREGDVRALLEHTDDMFVISMPGDRIAVSFDASAFPSLPPGHTRTFLLHAVGYSKEMNFSSATPDQLTPLPFHRMSRYPYGREQSYPSSAAHLDYLARYNTRVIRRGVPLLEASGAGRAVSPKQ
jgi:Tfp pilus assembly protein PilF